MIGGIILKIKHKTEVKILKLLQKKEQIHHHTLRSRTDTKGKNTKKKKT